VTADATRQRAPRSMLAHAEMSALHTISSLIFRSACTDKSSAALQYRPCPRHERLLRQCCRLRLAEQGSLPETPTRERLPGQADFLTSPARTPPHRLANSYR